MRHQPPYDNGYRFRLGLRLIILLTLGCFAIQPRALVYAQAPDDDGAFIISTPNDGDQLFGLVEIRGTAQHPTRFVGYTLEWSNAQNPDVWLPIQQIVTQQVREADGLLGQWDTVRDSIPDGLYQIRLRGFLQDGETRDAILRGVRVVNSEPTDIPTQPASLSGDTPTPDPLGAPVIPQPPTVTPRPTFEQPNLAPPADLNPETSPDEALLDFSAAQTAVCNGMLFSTVFFGLILAYLVLRGQISPITRRLWWQIRAEMDDDERA